MKVIGRFRSISAFTLTSVPHLQRHVAIVAIIAPHILSRTDKLSRGRWTRNYVSKSSGIAPNVTPNEFVQIAGLDRFGNTLDTARFQGKFLPTPRCLSGNCDDRNL